ncbi:unnamed protein product, partial [Laminaria digitata]
AHRVFGEVWNSSSEEPQKHFRCYPYCSTRLIEISLITITTTVGDWALAFSGPYRSLVDRIWSRNQRRCFRSWYFVYIEPRTDLFCHLLPRVSNKLVLRLFGTNNRESQACVY